MTYKEAFEVCRDLPPTNYSEACKKALEKQIPKPPNMYNGPYGATPLCPVCGRVLNILAGTYCSQCGQRIEWYS